MAEPEHNNLGGVQFMEPPKNDIECIDKGYTGKAVDASEMGLPLDIVTQRTGLSEEQILNKEEPPKKKETSKAVEVPNVKYTGKVEYNNRPSVSNQLQDKPETVTLGPTQTEVYNLGDAVEKEAYNALMRREGPENAPGIMVLERNKEFHEGQFIILVDYQELLYQQL